jgi:RNA polymerase sigma-70 factor (ECF subfamily)
VDRGAFITDLRQAMDRLPEPQRIVLLYRYVQEYNYQEIAEAMNLPLNTVKSHLFRARKQLQEWLEEYQEGGRRHGK